jgi:pyruvate,water dikinase
MSEYILWFEDREARSVAKVGGKNASLAEMIQTLTPAGINVPGGFAVTVDAYLAYLDHNKLRRAIKERLDAFDAGLEPVEQAGAAVRDLLKGTELPAPVIDSIRVAYSELSRRYGAEATDVAVRSSATAEDLPGASFAGQHESFLNVAGIDAVVEATLACFASLFKDRAIAYRHEMGFEHEKVALSVGVQKMVRSDTGGAGVMFSIDTETGFPRSVVINAAWGLGESVVQGTVTPDEYQVFKPLLADPHLHPIIEKVAGQKESKVVYAPGGRTETVETTTEEQLALVLADEEILQLARWAVAIEDHYGVAMDMEWAKDGEGGALYIVQARPETVQSERGAAAVKTYALKGRGPLLATGLSVGDAIATGPACVIESVADIGRFVPGSVLVTSVTSPDWVPIMKQAAAIVTDHGGRTSHAAIVSRELSIPAIVGTGSATSVIQDGQAVTVSCAEGEEGHVYDGILAYEATDLSFNELPAVRTQLMMNIADPSAALRWWRLPARGVGLARMEFIINNIIKIHPMALQRFDDLKDAAAREEIDRLTRGYADRSEYFVERLASGIARIAASRYPDPVIVRMSDFKTNEYAHLIGGAQFEPVEENPMLGFRGASRYYNERYRDGFALECRAIKRVREHIGLNNVVVMIPFCRTLEEADRVLEVMAENGLTRGEDGLEVYVMAEIPSNVLLAEEFARRFDGFSIGSNDLTQLVLGVDRDSKELVRLFDERNQAVKRMIAQLIQVAHRCGSKVGICGQAPSDYPEFAAWLVELGIDSISLNPDSIIGVLQRVIEQERALERAAPAATADALAIDMLTPDQREVWLEVERLWHLAVQGDGSEIKAALHPRYRGWDSTSAVPHDRAEAVRAAVRDTAGIAAYVLTPLSIEVYDTRVAVAHYRYAVQLTGGDRGPETVEGRWTETYLKEDERWLLISVAGGPSGLPDAGMEGRR